MRVGLVAPSSGGWGCRLGGLTPAPFISMGGKGIGMPTRDMGGRTALEALRRRFETTETKCPACGYIDDEGNWTSQTDGQQIVYHHVCPSCEASREYTFELNR